MRGGLVKKGAIVRGLCSDVMVSTGYPIEIDIQRSSCRACEAAFGCAAVVKPVSAVYLKHRIV
jgi:hypothetical protein